MRLHEGLKNVQFNVQWWRGRGHCLLVITVWIVHIRNECLLKSWVLVYFEIKY